MPTACTTSNTYERVKHYAPNMTYDYGSRAAALWPER
jgi:hypothetical protein